MRPMASLRWLAMTTLAAAVTACGAGTDPAAPDSPPTTPTPPASLTEPAPAGPEGVPSHTCEVPEMPADPPEWGPPTQPELRQELLDMRDVDQAERRGEVPTNGDRARTARLREIIDEYGWPTPPMVGADGASAAWLIAQHSDQDVEFQREALELMCAAAANGEADPTDVAYLVDRVAVNSGEPQVYGTQVGGCEEGRAVPRPIADADGVDERRARVGLEPLADYLALFDEGCAGT